MTPEVTKTVFNKIIYIYFYVWIENGQHNMNRESCVHLCSLALYVFFVTILMNSLQMALLQDSNCIGIVTRTCTKLQNECCPLGSSASAVSTGDVSFTTIEPGPWNNGMNPTRQGLFSHWNYKSNNQYCSLSCTESSSNSEDKYLYSTRYS
jgi:hypothetical protein